MKRLSCLLFSFSAFLLAELLLPQQALAWGPGAHMVAGNWILQNLTVLSGAAAEALMHYPGQFLYGSLLVLSARAMVDVLQKGAASPVLGLDPVGSNALALAGKVKDRQWTSAGLRVTIPPVLENIPPTCTL